MTLSVAIVGSGPSGFYTVEALLKARDDVQVDIIDRLPTPYGLIRAGVAPDHAKTKNVARAYEKSAIDERVRYFGNVEVGRDVSIAELREMYDAVVLATGASVDRKLGIPGDDKEGIVGVAAFVGWYNGHPDFRDLAPNLDTDSVAVIGIGNVAVDVARVLTKTPAEMAVTDLAEHAAERIHKAPISDVHMFGRRGPVQAQFTNVELREMGQLENCTPIVDLDQLPEEPPEHIAQGLSERDLRLAIRNLGTLREFADVDPAGKSKRVHFSFFSNPIEILGRDKVEGIRLERTTVVDGRAVGLGKTYDVPCGLIIPAIGYQSDPIDGVPFAKGRTENDNGRIDKGLYAVGWAKRGPSGVIGTNKPDGDQAKDQICSDVGNGEKPGRVSLQDHLQASGVRHVSFEEWKKIDSVEVANAKNGAPRKKFARIEEMLTVLDDGEVTQAAS